MADLIFTPLNLFFIGLIIMMSVLGIVGLHGKKR